MSKANIDGGGITGYIAETAVVLAPSASPAINAALGGVFTLTPAENETISVTNIVNGSRLNLVVTTSGVTSYTLTFGTGFKSTGTLATGTTTAKVFVVEFLAVGGTYTEVSRTAAQ